MIYKYFFIIQQVYRELKRIGLDEKCLGKINDLVMLFFFRINMDLFLMIILFFIIVEQLIEIIQFNYNYNLWNLIKIV